ncbi:sensor histidine kinase [Paenibacillus chungangensis]|uniref:Sensor histidine kinase n=1 Tax=Paenibacillus chungangensis TaxID=696535 RepID=A0ABW3HQM0_9BACL
MKAMDLKLNSFSKVLILVIGLLVLMMLFFSIYNRITVDVIKREIEAANLNKLMFLKNQLEEKFNGISINSIMLANDPEIRELEYKQLSGDPYDRQKLKRSILEQISLQSGITGWWTDITVYSRLTHEVISTTSNTFDFEDAELIGGIKKGWQYDAGASEDQGTFVWHAVAPSDAYEDLASARLIIKTAMGTEDLRSMLDQYKADGHGDPMLYSPQFGLISNHTIDASYASDVRAYLDSIDLEEGQSNLSLQLSDQHYVATYQRLYGLDWYLVDSIPVDQMLSPVTKARHLFYTFTAALLLLSIAAANILYRQLQVPIRELIKNIQGIKRGNYASRIRMEGSGEFVFLFRRFNEMAEEIQTLLERVYEERIRSREALLKQLQSQINPHFLYNCLFFIKNQARLGEEEAVVAMALNLGEYFRYTTRLGKGTTKLQDELDVIVNYLEIQNLRTNRFSYRMDIPESMKGLEIPRLILQPVIENSVIHGIEPRDGHAHISIVGEQDAPVCRIIVSDDGVGIGERELQELQTRLDSADNPDNVSFGLWNVNQRIKLMFGGESGLSVARNPDGGTVVTLTFLVKEDTACSEF